MPITEEVIYHTTFTCEQCNESETRTEVVGINEFRPQETPVSMTSVSFRIGDGVLGMTGKNALLHKTCIRDWLVAQAPP